MPRPTSRPEGPADAVLLEQLAGGDETAADLLFRRHHEPARRYARTLADHSTADDLTSEAFIKVFAAIRAGGGPDQSLRPYLLTVIRNTWISRIRGDQHLVLVDEPPGDGAGVSDGVEDLHESTLVDQAFRSLPVRWQTVLWHTAVEGEEHREVGRLLGLDPNAVAALAHRAREGLRRAYLEAHLANAEDEACRAARHQLPAYVRDRLGPRQARALESHLDMCRGCAAGAAELAAVNENLGAVLAPAVLGAGVIHGAAASGPAAMGTAHRPGRLRPRAVVAAAVVVAVVLASGAWALAARRPGPAPETGPSPLGTVRQPEPVASPERSLHPVPAETPRASGPGQPAGGIAVPVVADPVGAADQHTAPAPVLPSPPTPSTPPPTSPSTSPPLPPSPTAPSLPAGWTADDLSVGQPYQSDFGAHRHLQLRTHSAIASALLRLELSGVTGWTLHEEDGFDVRDCQEVAAGTVLCRVPAGNSLIGLDVVARGTFVVSAEIYAERNADPQPGNNALRLTG